jgi:small nuclear ribonucleoprotein (snRNP)-like protein
MADLKNGSTVNGTLVEIDRFMNLKIENAIITSKEGDQFHKA